MDEPYEIDYTPIKVPLAEIPHAIINRIKRERDAELAALHRTLPGVLSLMTHVVRVTWDSVRFLCANKVEQPSRRLDFAVAVPPLSRTILDAVFNIVFIFDKPTLNARKYCAGGWREALELQGQLTARYGAREEWNNIWQIMRPPWLGLQKTQILRSRKLRTPGWSSIGRIQEGCSGKAWSSQIRRGVLFLVSSILGSMAIFRGIHT